MKRHFLLRLYPREWRERYGEELAALLEAQRPLRVAVIADLVRGAFDAHLHPLRRDSGALRRSHMSERGAIAARATVVWTPLAAVAIAAMMVLIDFWYGHTSWWYSSSGGPVVGGLTVPWSHPQSLMGDQSVSPWVRFLPYQELYDLALHLAMLAGALAGALIFAAVARMALRGDGGGDAAGEGGFEPPTWLIHSQVIPQASQRREAEGSEMDVTQRGSRNESRSTP